jgi:hypothetical protein
MHTTRIVAGGLLIGGLALAGCGSDDTDAANTAGPDLPDTISCGTQYRPEAEQMTDAESTTLTVERGDDLLGNRSTETFETMTLEVTYVGDAPEGHSVRIDVTTPDGASVHQALYQVGTPLQDIRFAGGHGFTGLSYIYHDGALLQVWCDAD